jgi:hypothetical protein
MDHMVLLTIACCNVHNMSYLLYSTRACCCTACYRGIYAHQPCYISLLPGGVGLEHNAMLSPETDETTALLHPVLGWNEHQTDVCKATQG